jgi:hypothetical protein
MYVNGDENSGGIRCVSGGALRKPAGLKAHACAQSSALCYAHAQPHNLLLLAVLSECELSAYVES